MTCAADPLDAAGWLVTEPRVTRADVEALRNALAGLDAGRGGARNVLEVPAVRALARAPAVRAVAESVLGPRCAAVRGLLFDKTPSANWRVAWHQDLAIAVRARGDTPGYGPWSEKAGVPHTHAPASVLERMLAVRVHLDECGDDNGPLRVLPGSHREGRLDASAIAAWKTRVAQVTCRVACGGLLAFRPLLLHASAPASSPAHRRVIHIEFALGEPGGGLEWHASV